MKDEAENLMWHNIVRGMIIFFTGNPSDITISFSAAVWVMNTELNREEIRHTGTTVTHPTFLIQNF